MSSTEGFRTTTPASPPVSGTTGSQWAPPSNGNSSTTDVAKDQASSVASGAADAAKNVAGTAKEQAGQVATEAKKQVKDLVGQARSELTDQAQVQQQRIAGGLHSVGDQLKAMAEGSSEPGPASDLTHQAADKAHQIADFFDNRDPGSVLNEVRSFARKQPGVFLALSLGAGVLAGRLARGLSADTDTGTSTARDTSTAPALTGAPVDTGLPAVSAFGAYDTPSAFPTQYSGTPTAGSLSTGDLGVGR